MTRTNLFSKLQFLTLAVMTNLAVIIVKAQDKAADLKVDVNVNKGDNPMGGDWMSNPLIWVVGALILIVIIALVARGGSKAE